MDEQFAQSHSISLALFCSWTGERAMLRIGWFNRAFWRFGLSGSWRGKMKHENGVSQKPGTLTSRLDLQIFPSLRWPLSCTDTAICFSQALDSHLGHDVRVCQWSYQTLLNCVCLVTNWTFTYGYFAARESHVQNLEGLERSKWDNPERGLEPASSS